MRDEPGPGVLPVRDEAGPGVLPVRGEPGSGVAAGEDEAGSGTLLAVAVIPLLVLAGTVVIGLGQVAVARHRADTAADAAALAGASTLLAGDGDPCAVATRLVVAHGARLASCRVVGDVVQVSCTVALPAAYTLWVTLPRRHARGLLRRTVRGSCP